MSKTLIVLLIAVGVGVAVNRRNGSADPAPVASTSAATAHETAADTLVEDEATFFGKVGAKLVGSTVLKMSATTQQAIQAIGPALKKADGADGRRAREAARKATNFDALSHQELEAAHPVKAVQAAIDARNYAQVAKGILKNGP